MLQSVIREDIGQEMSSASCLHHHRTHQPNKKASVTLVKMEKEIFWGETLQVDDDNEADSEDEDSIDKPEMQWLVFTLKSPGIKEIAMFV